MSIASANMAQTNYVKKENPVKLYITYKSGGEHAGKFVVYDKEAKETTYLDMIQFISLIEYSAVSGYSDSHKTGLFSNEVGNTTQEEMVVYARPKKGETELKEVARGLYADIKDKMNALGVTYDKVIYAMYDGKLAKLTLEKKSTQGAFIDFDKEKASNTHAVSVTGSEEKKKGATKYMVPTFEKGDEITPESLEKAKDLLNVVKEYKTSNNAKDEQSELPMTNADTETEVEPF